jgi:cytochrome P450
MSRSATAPTAITPSMVDNFFLEAMKPAFREDPYPLYERFRGGAPLLRVADTIWFALGHAEVTAMLRHPRLSTDEQEHATTKAGREPDPNRARSLLFMDPPDHTRLRGQVARAFTPRRIEDLRVATEGITNELVEAMATQRGGTVDLIEAFAYPLPVRVICTLLGVPARDEAIFTNWSRGIARSVDPSILRSPEIEAAIAEARLGLRTYIGELLAERRRKPGDDLLSALAVVDVDGDSITAGEIVSLAQLLLVAGHETTVNLIGNGALALLRAPDQLALLRQRPELIGPAVDEFLRFDGPVQITQRVAMADLDLFGQKVRKGDEILLILGAANRDPAAFDEPHRLDVTRDARKHVAFGGGIHHCLGAVLARMEGHVAFKALLEAFPTMQPAAPPTRRPTFTLRGLETLLIAL